MNASISDKSNASLTRSTSMLLIPYAGNSSEWKIPATPASFAALAALQLGWVALEDFIMLIADVDTSERDAVRDRVKTLIGNWFGPLPPP